MEAYAQGACPAALSPARQEGDTEDLRRSPYSGVLQEDEQVTVSANQAWLVFAFKVDVVYIM